jgi:hypothetical protein
MKTFHDLAEDSPTKLNEKFFQEYGWTVNN